MDIDNLVKMANRIGQFFAAMPDAEAASKEIAQHLRKFWEPRMRRELLAHIDARQGEGLLPIVQQAVLTHRASLEPAPATAPAPVQATGQAAN
ncbi:formate dehydrogenase subunit delta [Ideonella sp. DXS29W]|uniref:Formate dehydrogenase subunit delta n=1 Tax=Ideonella lacteola TaxID=2984193 RepID=A0ABU9BWW3_9BURK